MDHRKVVMEIHRRRMTMGDKSSVSKTAAEVGVFLRYGKTPTIHDLHPQGGMIHLGSKDDKGRSFLIVTGYDSSWVIDRELVADLYVMITPNSQTEYDIVGWLPRHELLGATEKLGRYEVTREHLLPMPEKYDFTSSCAEMPCNGSGIWDWDSESWDCFECSRHRYDEFNRDWYERYLAKQGG